MFSLVKNMATATAEEMILPKSFGTNPYQFKSIHSWLVSAELVLALKARVLEHGISYHMAPFDFYKIDNVWLTAPVIPIFIMGRPVITMHLTFPQLF